MLGNFIRIKDVIILVGFSRSKIYEMIEKGKFPRPMKLGPRIAVWTLDEINEWKVEFVKASREGE